MFVTLKTLNLLWILKFNFKFPRPLVLFCCHFLQPHNPNLTMLKAFREKRTFA